VLVDFYCFVDRWDNHFCQLLNVHETNGVRQAEKHSADPLVLEGKMVNVNSNLQKATNAHRGVEV
jgi:hypothetical protein